MDNNWYVYRHIRLDVNLPFYIGIGKKPEFARAFEFKPNKRSEWWCKIYDKTAIDVEILFSDLTKEQAIDKEIEFIKLYGRQDLKSGCLVNMTDGGDGATNYIKSLELRKRLSEAKIGDKNPMFGRKFPNKKRVVVNRISKTSKKIRSIKTGKSLKVYSYLDGSLIGCYCSMNSACRALGFKNNSKPLLVANGKRNHAKGYVFRNDDSSLPINIKSAPVAKSKSNINRKKELFVYASIDATEPSGVYESIDLACRSLGIKSRSSVLRVLNQERKTANGYYMSLHPIHLLH